MRERGRVKERDCVKNMYTGLGYRISRDMFHTIGETEKGHR